MRKSYLLLQRAFWQLNIVSCWINQVTSLFFMINVLSTLFPILGILNSNKIYPSLKLGRISFNKSIWSCHASLCVVSTDPSWNLVNSPKISSFDLVRNSCMEDLNPDNLNLLYYTRNTPLRLLTGHQTHRGFVGYCYTIFSVHIYIVFTC